MNAQLYREAMELAAKYNIAVLAHCEDINLVNGGVMNADVNARELGLGGITIPWRTSSLPGTSC